jgi:hypothetical protein
MYALKYRFGGLIGIGSVGSWDPSSIQIIAEKEKKRKRKEGGRQEEEKESPPSQSLDPIKRKAENGSLTQNRYYVQDEIDALLSATGYVTFNTQETFKLLTHPIYLFRPDIRSVRNLNFVVSTNQKFSTATWPKPCQRL